MSASLADTSTNTSDAKADSYVGISGLAAFDTKLGSTNIDHVTDFTVVEDTIELSHSIFGALGTGALDASSFTIGTAADGGDRIIYNNATGALFYDVDGAGGPHRCNSQPSTTILR